MMSELTDVLDSIRRRPDCHLDPPRGFPAIPEGMALPPDLRQFYELVGGARLFSERVCPGRVRILDPNEFQRIDLAITGDLQSNGPFHSWFAIADVMDGNYIAIDLNPEHQGLCYDAFHETFAEPGYVQVIADSFTDFLRRLLKHEQDSSYWLEDDFVALGEAFMRYGYKPIAENDK